MKAKVSRRLVIDASVARAAGGEETTSAVSKSCRAFLQDVLEKCHRLVMTKNIKDEWDKHQSRFVRGWRLTMVAKKKFVKVDIPAEEEQKLREWIENSGCADHVKKAMLKDALLVEAALATDKRIITLDATARTAFEDLAKRITELRDVIWSNPVDSI